jgi:hypothetical protein
MAQPPVQKYIKLGSEALRCKEVSEGGEGALTGAKQADIA